MNAKTPVCQKCGVALVSKTMTIVSSFCLRCTPKEKDRMEHMFNRLWESRQEEMDKKYDERKSNL